MFGHSLEPPKCKKRTKPKPMVCDIQLPTPFHPGVYAHIAREPNTDCHVQLLHHRQRLQDGYKQIQESEAKRLMQEFTAGFYDRHAEKKYFQSQIQDRFQQKLQAYEGKVEERRKKLRALLCHEEQEYIRETIDKAQRGVDSKMQEMKQKAELLKAKREAERMAIVNEKRLMQKLENNKELRPVLIKRNLVESKMCQLEQMKEREMRKEAERELDDMYYKLMLKEMSARMERDTQELLKRSEVMKDTLETWRKQVEGKELLKQEAKQVALEDHIEMVKLREQIRREEIEALDSKRRKRDQVAKELKEQIREQEKFMAQRKLEEDTLNVLLCKLAHEELEKERMKIQDTTAQAKRETAIYRQHLKLLEEERKKEEEQLNVLLEEHHKMIEEKQRQAYCKLKEAKDKLHQDVLAGRAEQLKYKQQEAENQLKLKEAENELLRMTYDMNERLQAEHDRLQAEEVRLYREDLKRQIEENAEKKRLEKEELERELAEGLAEEERARKEYLEILNANLERQTIQHPFRRVLDRQTCPCPKSTNPIL